MSYFSQKKKQKKEKIFFAFVLFVLSLISFASFCDDKSGGFIFSLNGLKFQVYLVTWLLFFVLFFKKKFVASSLAGLLLIVSYLDIASSVNLFKNTKIENATKFEYTYGVKDPLDEYESKGVMVFSQDSIAPYHVLDVAGRKLMVLEIDFSKEKDLKDALSQLQNFVLNQDNPVLILGDLGFYAWSDAIKEFSNKTGLQVKNKMIFKSYNPLEVPKLNVLGFSNIGIEQILQKNGHYHFILLAK